MRNAIQPVWLEHTSRYGTSQGVWLGVGGLCNCSCCNGRKFFRKFSPLFQLNGRKYAFKKGSEFWRKVLEQSRLFLPLFKDKWKTCLSVFSSIILYNQLSGLQLLLGLNGKGFMLPLNPKGRQRDDTAPLGGLLSSGVTSKYEVRLLSLSNNRRISLSPE